MKDELVEKQQDDIIFQDKLRLTRLLVQKELVLIEEWNSLLRLQREHRMRDDEFERECTSEIGVAAQIMMQLYDYFQFGAIQKFKKKYPEKYKDMEVIVLKYKKSLNRLSMNDMSFLYDNVRHAMELGGYHDVSVKTDKGSDWND